jgi:GT2 family glycosyltransferase
MSRPESGPCVGDGDVIVGQTAESRQRAHVAVDGKFLRVDGQRFLVKGVTYGTFAPESNGEQFPSLAAVRDDFRAMAAAGVNTVRVYTPPSLDVLDAAAGAGLRVIVGLPWTQHVAFLDDAGLCREIRRDVRAAVQARAAHPAVLMFALGNEIPPAVVRWHGRSRVEAFLRDLVADAREAVPSALYTYVNFPPTEYLDLSPFDVHAVNVYLHREADLRAYLARLQQIAGAKPLLLAEAGADSLREGEAEQARVTAMHVRAAFEEGLCGAVAFAWTDEWWRGGQPVDDWAFGLVDRERRPKAALASVSRAFADAPFSVEQRERWPTVSVVVCAYNAADTLDDCLASLDQLTYPDFEVIVVNDGSRDGTGEIAKRYARARVVDIPNGGLSAARNVGLELASGEVVAYTDADVAVDPDWLTYLVQPMLRSNAVGSGGPNVVPADDPWMAQCVARSPGGPTQVLLDDRVAEHVPGCNMAFRREALRAIGGFNPIYLRAGDDVDVCWRLQARGWRIGFAPSALVWHRHRSSVKAYWRQQVGYGEGESWLMHQHPDKFAGGHMVWRGRIYSHLPFVRALTRMRVNTGTWGLAAFPSVYHTGTEPAAYLPHTLGWQAGSLAMLVAGLALALVSGHFSAAWLLVMLGLAGVAITVARCVGYARRTDIAGVALPGRSVRSSRWRTRAMIALLHFLQPIARIRGRIRGVLAPPHLPAVKPAIARELTRPVPDVADLGTAIRLYAGASAERRFWSETWFSVDAILTRLIEAVRVARLTHTVDLDDGWSENRDLSVALGRWAWIDLAALVEEHAGGRVLVRTRTTVRPTALTAVLVLGSCLAIVASALGLEQSRWPALGVALLAAGVVALGYAIWRTASALAGLHAVVGHAMAGVGARPVGGRRARVRFGLAGPVVAHAGQTALALLCVAGLGVGSSLLVRDAAEWTAARVERRVPETAVPGPVARPAMPPRPTLGLAVAPNGDVYVADAQEDVIRRVSLQGVVARLGAPAGTGGVLAEPRAVAGGPVVRFDSPGGVSVAPNGDVYVADSVNHRVCRIDRLTGAAILVAGTGHAGFSGDGGRAVQAALNAPSAVAFDRGGDLYIADAGNHRVRKVSRRTGLIATVAGDGAPATSGDVGDGQPAVRAHLSWPSDLALAPNGDLYIADTEHNRVRRVDRRTGRIATVAGDGTAGLSGDGGPAVRASLSSPTGLALAQRGGKLTLYIADSSNGRVRVVGPDGLITSLATGKAPVFGTPARLAYHSRGWLYVVDARNKEVRALPLGGGTVHPILPPARATTGRRVM